MDDHSRRGSAISVHLMGFEELRCKVHTELRDECLISHDIPFCVANDFLFIMV
jgi:hypothetical protein